MLGTNRSAGDVPMGMTAGKRGVLILLVSLSAILTIAMGMFLLLSDSPVQPVTMIGASLMGIAVFSIMVVRHEWLLLLGILAGHTIFYGRFPNHLGMKLRDTVGPSDVLFFLAFIAAIVFWASIRERPGIPKSLIVPPVLLFIYTTAYVMIAFFLWGRQDNALIQVIGWLYFTVAVPTYLCLSSGKIWKPFFLVLFAGLCAGALMAFFVEADMFKDLISRTGYGGLGARSFGDLTVRTNQLGMAVMGTLVAIVVAAYARNTFWKAASVIAGLSGAMIMFLDRGRATYAGMFVALVLLILFLPNAARVRFALRGATALIVGVLIVLAVGGEVEQKLSSAVDKAAQAVELTSQKAIEADPGIAFRARRLRQAEAVFRANPLFGGGPGVHFGQDVDWMNFETTFVTFIDNSWTYPTAVGGLAGMSLILLCYISFVGACIYAFRKLKHPFHRALSVVPLAHMAWLLVCSPVNWWMVDRFHVAAFSFAVGMVYALVYYEKVNGSEKPVIEVGD